MIRNCLLVPLSPFLFTFSGHAGEVTIDKKMESALKEFNPQFVAWTASDYTPTIQRDAIKKNRCPYSLVLDVNEDKSDDLFLDGHDDKHNLLICFISNSRRYDVIVIRQMDLLNPKELENMNDGAKEMGLNYYLWPDKRGTGFYSGISSAERF